MTRFDEPFAKQFISFPDTGYEKQHHKFQQGPFELAFKDVFPVQIVHSLGSEFISGQSYKVSTLVNYDSRAESISNLLVITTLES